MCIVAMKHVFFRFKQIETFVSNVVLKQESGFKVLGFIVVVHAPLLCFPKF